MSKYSKKAQQEIHKKLHEHKTKGKLKNRRQAIPVGLSVAREKGY